MAIYRTVLMLLTVTGLLGGPGWAYTQEATTPSQYAPLQKTIGGTTKARVEPSLIVMSADGATLVVGVSAVGTFLPIAGEETNDR